MVPIFIIRNSLEVCCVLIFVIWLKDLTAPTLWSLRIPKIKFCYDLEFFSICYKNKRYKVLGWVQDDLITFGWILFFTVFRSELLTCIFFFFLFVVNFVIHWNKTAMGLHVFPIPIPPPTSLSTRSP